MTPPREIHAGQTFEVISRCISRLFLLAPSYEVQQTFLYLLGHYARKHGITLYALVLMANHYHLLGLDKHGNLPHFMRDLNSFVARVLNHHYGRDDKFWSGDGYHIVRPINPEDVWARLMYITSNPINADLVKRTEDYPGFVTTPGKIGRTICARRPSFFREEGVMPETADVVFEVPACFELTHDEYVARYDRELREAEFAAKRRRRAHGNHVVGHAALLKVSVDDRPRSKEAHGRSKGHIACKCAADRVAAIRARKAFLDEYQVCREEWREDVAGVAFPPGTWWVCQFAGAGVRIASGEDAASPPTAPG